jgi:hypothetical protein
VTVIVAVAWSRSSSLSLVGTDRPNMIVYKCSPLASATNWAALRVDGGVVRDIV